MGHEITKEGLNMIPLGFPFRNHWSYDPEDHDSEVMETANNYEVLYQHGTVKNIRLKEHQRLTYIFHIVGNNVIVMKQYTLNTLLHMTQE